MNMRRSVFCLGRFVLCESRDFLKERDKQKREAIKNLYCFKNIALNSFEIRKAKLKNDDKDGNRFIPLKLYVFPK